MNISPQLDPARRAPGHLAACVPAARPRLGPRPRRGSGTRRTLGRVAAALAIAATVLVVGNDPAQGAAAVVDSTRLSGATRYETAVEIAETYVETVEEDSARATVDTVIITSGEDEHFAYALPTPALSRLHDAPLLLTPPDELHSSVTTFLTRYNISFALIVGGTDVVSAEVQSSITAISGIAVTRIEGDDEYATAVEIAERVGWSPGSPGEIRGKGRTALLATGEHFADALAAGPLAYQGEHPILLTRSAELPDAVAKFLTDSRTEHAVILGGNAAVSAEVENEVTGLGIAVERWRGSDRFGTAVDIAEALLGFDTPQECFDDSGDVGLAYGWRSPDAIVSGSLLGELCAPLLLTEHDVLPSVVEDFLDSDDFVTGDASGKLHFTVFGGSAAVTEDAVDDAVDAASLVALGATFEAYEGGCHFTVTFAEPVRTGDAEVISSYLNGNSPFRAADLEGTPDAGSGTSTTKAVVTLADATTVAGATVPTGCSTPLRARDRIGIVAGEIRAASDNRRVGRVEYFIADDDTPPTLSLNATEGSDTVWVEASEPLVESTTDSDDLVRVLFKRPGIADEPVDVAPGAGVTRFEVELPDAFGTRLKIGDNVSIAADEVEDLAGNANAAIRRVVARDTTAPRISQITVTEPSPVTQASVILNGTDAQDNAQAAFEVQAKAATTADGAAGNHWTIDLDVRSSRPTSWSSTQITAVQVSEATRRIQVMALATAVDTADVNDVVDALNASRTFNQLFVALVTGTGSDLPVDTGGRVRFTGGTSTADLTVEWTEAVRDCDDADDPVRVRLIEIDADGNGTTDFDLDGFTFGASDVVFIEGDGGDSIIAERATCDTTTPGVRPGTLVARIQSASIDNLPSTRSTALVRSGAVTDLAGNANARQTGVGLQRP
ncbi:MAG: cell wall-binding repeat-containing protein [Acidimicrobiaceae bacterium]|nr:cell wall-binding repeat-containing protein [Acidimicrobiaceae bacterium]